MGLAYAGTARQDVADLILPSLEDSSAPMDVIGLAALALGMVNKTTNIQKKKKKVCFNFLIKFKFFSSFRSLSVQQTQN